MKFDIMKLFDDANYISPGSIGGKIKRLRELRGLTQKQLGIMCGFSASTADVRIAQYEKNKKIPREKALKDIAGALGVDEYSLFDADILPYNRMYHALFDMEDFHGLHPVKKDDGYYLEISGPTMLGQNISRRDFDDFLKVWYEQRQKYLATPSDSDDEKTKKETEYALWKYEYPHNIAKETTKKIQDQMKMNSLQMQMDALNAQMQSESELERIDSEMREFIATAKEKYTPITMESEFILLIKDIIDANIPIERFSPEERIDMDYEHIHIASFKTDEILRDIRTKKYFALFLCHIETMRHNGLKIDRKITSKNKELYVTFEIAASQGEYLENLSRYWNDIVSIKVQNGEKSAKLIKELNEQLLANITGDNDMILKM